jgi:hypothetical protein
MADTSQTVSRASVARLNVQSMHYAEYRYSELSARIDAVQVTLRAEAERRETRKARERCTERIMFVIVGAILGIVLDRVHTLPAFAIVAIGAAPEVAREIVEMITRL